jgi:hypothetical protein
MASTRVMEKDGGETKREIAEKRGENNDTRQKKEGRNKELDVVREVGK